jgi:hypothetical protein
MDIAGLTIGLVGLVIAVWQSISAQRARKELAESRRDQRETQRKVEEIARFLLPPDEAAALERRELPAGWLGVDFADVNNDGEQELVIQHGTGVHGSMLRAFGWKDPMTFGELGAIGTGTPEGFRIGDFDADGRVEVAAIEADYDRPDPERPGDTLPYVAGARREQLFRWEDDRFRLIEDHPLPLPTEGPIGPGRRWHR